MSFRYEIEGAYKGKKVSREYIACNELEAKNKAFQDNLKDVKITNISPLERITLECEN